MTYMTLMMLRTFVRKDTDLLPEVLLRRLQLSQAEKSVLEVNDNAE